MKTPTPLQIKNQFSVMQDELVGAIHDRLLDDNDLDLAHAFNASCVEIAELYGEIEELKKRAAQHRISPRPF